MAQVKADFVFRFLEGMKQEAKIASGYAVGAMAKKAKAYCTQMISLTDHSLDDLARMGHPYATAHPANPHDPPESVHTQTGELLAGLKDDPPTLTRDGAIARVHNDSEKDEWIQRGTQSMIARPYMHAVQSKFADEIVAAGATIMQQRLAAKRSA